MATFASQNCTYLLELLNFRIDLGENAFHFHTKSLAAAESPLVLSNACRDPF